LFSGFGGGSPVVDGATGVAAGGGGEQATGPNARPRIARTRPNFNVLIVVSLVEIRRIRILIPIIDFANPHRAP
jgi:hypothetical protein